MQRGGRGVILIGVMGILALLSLVITDLLFNVGKQMRYESLFGDKEELRQTAYNRLALVMGVLNEIHFVDKGLKSPRFQGWDAEGLEALLKDFELAEDVSCELEVWDETAKLSLHKADETVLNELFAALELSKEAGVLSDSFLDFLEKDAEGSRQFGARESFYQRQEPPYFPKEADLLGFEELELVQGFEAAFFGPGDESALARLNFLKNMTSLHHKGAVNVNTSTQNVRYVLSQTDPEFDAPLLEGSLTGEAAPQLSLDTEVKEPEPIEFFKEKKPLLGKLFSVYTRIVGLRIDAQRYERHFRLEAFIAVPVKEAASLEKLTQAQNQKNLALGGKKPSVEEREEAKKKERLKDAATRVKFPEVIALREL